jgi:transcriptional regulator with XRE-family HTH domain
LNFSQLKEEIVPDRNGRQFRKRRVAYEIEQKEVSRKTNIPAPTISLWERGAPTPSFTAEKIKKLESALDALIAQKTRAMAEMARKFKAQRNSESPVTVAAESAPNAEAIA